MTMVEKSNACGNGDGAFQLDPRESTAPVNPLEYRNEHTLVELPPSQRDGGQNYKEIEKREAAEMENGPMFEFHDKWLRSFSEKPLTSRSQTRSQSYRLRSHDAQTASVSAPTDLMSHMRFRCLINSARCGMQRSTCSNSYTKSSEPLTLAERISIQNMMEREERRLNVLQRAAEEYDRRGKVLIDYELQKESASLNRIIELEKKKVNTTRERQCKLNNRMELAKNATGNDGTGTAGEIGSGSSAFGRTCWARRPACGADYQKNKQSFYSPPTLPKETTNPYTVGTCALPSSLPFFIYLYVPPHFT
ncbi:hypothetical protein TCDM_05762 [Trypanosoma cruzi Dm28c]|uniref:Uncharacterized protein n=1 Tax=Trypanosoma cruzi Dm28c TaxID=1416333 RepID=V5BDI1_TRYCR|nr:hypothetical protein TCDM_05762 [Trypanosoma cruzi Dm28c]